MQVIWKDTYFLLAVYKKSLHHPFARVQDILWHIDTFSYVVTRFSYGLVPYTTRASCHPNEYDLITSLPYIPTSCYHYILLRPVWRLVSNTLYHCGQSGKMVDAHNPRVRNESCIIPSCVRKRPLPPLPPPPQQRKQGRKRQQRTQQQPEQQRQRRLRWK